MQSTAVVGDMKNKIFKSKEMLECQTKFNQGQPIESMQRSIIKKKKNHQEVKYIRILCILSI